MDKYAVIDLGSNTIRLVIYEIYENSSFKLVEDLSNTIRLQEGMSKSNSLSKDAMEKAMNTVRIFSDYCKDYNIKKSNIFAVATEAVRSASNGNYFIEELKKVSGIEFSVLSGNQEALYSYSAVVKTFALSRGIIIDIGGGSTEIIRFQNNNIVGYTSIPLGCISVTEKYLGFKANYSNSDLKELQNIVTLELKKLDWLKYISQERIIGLGGSIRTLSKIHKAKTDYPFTKTHNYKISSKEFYDLFFELSSMNLNHLRKVEGLSADRVDIILGGLSIFNAICEYVNTKEILISGYGLRDGVFFENAHKLGLVDTSKNALDFSLSNTMLLYNIRKKHASHVKKLSLELFDGLKPLHKLNDAYKQYLEIAALLHDIGIHISFYDHSLHSFYLILNSYINGLSHIEVLLVAIIASGYSESKLKEFISAKYLKLLTPSQYQAATKLSTIIRLSESLDKSETSKINILNVYVEKNYVQINTSSSTNADLEYESVKKHENLFKKAFKRNLKVI